MNDLVIATARPVNAELRAFLNWALVWVVLVNLPFVALWPVGAPPRGWAIMIAAMIGLIVKPARPVVRFIAFCVVLTGCVLQLVSGMFSLGPRSLLYSLQFMAELDPGHSREYVGAGALVLIILCAAWMLLRRPANFTRPIWIVSAGALFLGVAFVDDRIAADVRGHYNRFASADTPFQSATQESGFVSAARGDRHLVLVMVESLGQPQGNPAMAKRLFASYLTPAVQARYAVTRGTSPYYQSTTSGELRELCGRWGDFPELLEAEDSRCLPSRLKARGYDTVAMHSFTSAMFERATWYPNAGFAEWHFMDDLLKQGGKQCGGVFPGICDRYVPAMLAERLKHAARPTFLYWLTVNTHLPIPEGQNLQDEHCERFAPELAARWPQICRQFMVWHQLDTAMVREIMADDFPDADILLVGDHMPPYFDRNHRMQFDPAHVPWLLLRRRN